LYVKGKVSTTYAVLGLGYGGKACACLPSRIQVSFRILPRSRDGKDRMAIWIVPRAKVRFINIRRSTMGTFTKTSRFSSKRYSRRQASCQGVYSITRQRVVSLPRLFSLWGISELKCMFSPTLSCLFLLSSVSSRLPSITYMNSSPSCL
jgi:hypothetical protein